MATLVIPVDKESQAYRITVSLDGDEFTFRFQFNNREQAWYFDLLDSADTVLKAGVKMVADWQMLKNSVENTLPLGKVGVFDRTGEHKEPTADNLGQDLLLTYTES